MCVYCSQVGGAYVAYKVLDSKIQLSHDIKMARRLAPVRSAIAAKAKSGYNTATLFRDTLAKYGNKEALVFDNASFTFKELDIASNRVANWALATGPPNYSYTCAWSLTSDSSSPRAQASLVVTAWRW